MIASVDLSDRAQRAVADARRARETAWAVRLRSRAIRDQHAALRTRFDEGLTARRRDTSGKGFALTGALGDRPVWAHWWGGRLRCHPSLMTQARLLVEMGTVFVHADPPAWVEATVTGDPAAVMLTLARACDHVVSVNFSDDTAL
jgi:hypothetical protein